MIAVISATSSGCPGGGGVGSIASSSDSDPTGSGKGGKFKSTLIIVS
jgi:hypothetical protein